MAANDLMMKIQVLVDSGKSTAELDRLNDSLKRLTGELKTLENTQITPLARDLQEIKRVASTLRNVNLKNFSSSLDDLKQSMTGLGVGTSNLDKLRAAYQDLDAQLKSPIAKNLSSSIKDSQKDINDLRVKEIIPLQNEIRRLQAQKGLEKALRMDTLSASLRVSRAELANLRNEINKLLDLRSKSKKKDSGVIFTSADKAELSSLMAQYKIVNEEIIKGNVDLAKANQDIVKQYNSQIALKNRSLATSKNILDYETNRLKTLKEQLNIETDKERAIKSEITSLSKLTSSDALTKQLELQKQLAEQQTKKVDLTKQIKESEDLTKAELLRVQAMEKANVAAGKQAGNLTTLSRLFGKSGGTIREFGDALAFALGPQAAGFFAAATIATAVREITAAFFEANKSVENLLRGLNALSGGQGTTLFDQLVESSNRLGIPLKQVSQSFLEIQAATEGTNFEGQKTKELFDALANALTVTGADAVQFNRGFRALGQILSKDQLYAEELRQQLGEALPGAVQLFARALNISPKQLLQFMEAGVVEGENLRRTLVLVTREMEKTYKVANEQDFTFTQKAALAQNELNLLFTTIGNTGIWQAFGNVLLYARNQFRDLRSEVHSLSVTLKENARYWMDSIRSIDFSGVDINTDAIEYSLKESLKFIIQSFIDFPANIKTIITIAVNELALFGNEVFKLANNLGLPIQEAFERVGVYIKSVWQDVSNNINLVFTGMNAGFRELFYVPILELVGALREKIASIFSSMAAGFDAIGMFDGISQNLKSIADSWQQSNIGIEDQKAKIEELKQEFATLQTKIAQGLDPILKQNLDALKKKYIDLKNAVQQQYETQKQAAQSGIDGALAENNAKKQQRDTQIQLNSALTQQDEIAKRQRGTRNEILAINSAKNQTLNISKEQVKLDKEILGIQQTYQDTMLDINASKYQQLVDQGLITQEEARYLTEAEKADAARKAWVAAQDAVAAYNEEAEKGEKANKETLDILKQQADEQLRYAGGKAKEIGNQYRIKQIMEEQIALRERQKELIKDFPKILDKAEINTKANPVPEQEKKEVVNDLQSYLDQNKPIASIVPQIDKGSQQQAIESIRKVKAALDSLKQSSIVTVVLNLQDNTQGFIRTAGITMIPDQNIRITVNDDGKLHQAMVDAQGLKDAINGLQSGKKFTVEFLDPKGNVERIEEYVKEGKTVKITTDPQQIQSEGTRAGNAINQSVNAAIHENPVNLVLSDKNYKQDLETVKKFTQGEFSKTTVSIKLAKPDDSEIKRLAPDIQRALEAQKYKVIIDEPIVDGEKIRRLTIAQTPDLSIPVKVPDALTSENKARIAGLSQSAQEIFNKSFIFREDVFSGALNLLSSQLDPKFVEAGNAYMRAMNNGIQTGIPALIVETKDKLSGLTNQVKPEPIEITAKIPDALTSENKDRIAGLSKSAQEIFNKSFTFREDVFSGAIDLLSSQLNPKFVEAGNAHIRAMNSGIQAGIPALIAETKDKLSGLADQVKSEPIEITANTQPLIGQIQEQLAALQQSGATKIKVTLDENSGKLVVTADVSQAQGDIAALKTQIESSPAVQQVKFTYDPIQTTVDPAEQHVNREYDYPITRLPDAIQYVRRVYTGESTGMARGGLVPGGYSNRDSVSALLAPGEFVVPSSVVKALSPSFFYDLIRNRGLKVPQVSAKDNLSVPHFAAGGLVQPTLQPIVINVGGKPIHLSGSREAANQLAKVLAQTGRAL